MKKKLNIQLIAVSVLAIIATVIFTTSVFYDVLKKQVREELRTEAQIIVASGMMNSKDGMYQLADAYSGNMRITWIAADGTVIYDNDVNADMMENHAGRPEVKAAFAYGEGEAVRKSDTMNENTFYYAVRLEDGTAVRISRNADSMLSIFKSSFPTIAFIMIVMCLVCVVAAHFLTKRLIKPVEQVADNIDDFSKIPAYKELKPFMDKIRAQHENILEAAKMRQDFTANVSHELKTPLTAISGYAELIENRMAEGEQIENFAREIRKNSDRLLVLINDIINLSELDRSKKEAFEEIDLYELAFSCVQLLRVNASRKNIIIACTGQSCKVHGNKELLSELIMNLGENAIRYNREGGHVQIDVSMEDGHAVLSVKDDGIGIPKEHQEHVFERFYRVDKSRSKETGGTGLGLAIVKHISALHDATLSLESEEGKGTVIKMRM